MTKRQTRQYDMLNRVRAFGATHREQFPDGSAGSAAFTAVATALAQFEAAAMSKLTVKQAGRKARAAAKLAVEARIGAIAKTARIVAKTTPGADSTFQLPARRSDVAVLTAARAFLTEVEAVKGTFLQHGLPEGFIQDLRQAADTFEQAIEGRSAGRTRVSRAQHLIRTALAHGMDAVATLDVIVANTYGDDPLLLAEWKNARHVESGGRSASVGAPSTVPPPMPSEPADHPIPQLPAPSPATAAPAMLSATVDHALRRAS